ncbi:MAG TPA: alpha/beta fold hydrolase [Blastocatellia bacterium]|nr:alpha/beta fold hydrolase [Blastocatellia bacterium]
MMILHSTPARRQLSVIAAVLALLGPGLILWQGSVWGGEKDEAGKFTEEIVYVQSEDAIPNCGVIFAPPTNSARRIALIWIHGWGVNFYQPTYVKIGRALAARGYACITANTRMHDIGFNIGERNGKRLRGGGYWGVPSEEGRDIAAWINFATARGFKEVVVVGHSAGWAEVRRYQAEKQDPRVVGLVSASGNFWPNTEPPDSEMLAQATRLVSEGRGDDLLRFPNRRFPSFVSAATYLDIANTPPELTDFFGLRTPNPAVTRVRCPILAFFGAKEDVGTEKDLDQLKSCIRRQSSGPSRVDTVMIKYGDHMYFGAEEEVAQTIAKWADGLVSPGTVKVGTPNKR